MKRFARFFILILALAALSGCSGKQEAVRGNYIYYVNIDRTGIVPRPYVESGSDTLALIEEYLNVLSLPSPDVDTVSPFGSESFLKSYDFNEGLLVLDFDKSYSDAEPLYEIIRRAAIVRTLAQIDGVKGVMFLCDGVKITDSREREIGVMTGDMFVENNGAEINTYERAELKLYFADAQGTALVSCKEDVMYSSNISVDKLVVENIVKGPQKEGYYPVVDSSIEVLGVTTKDGTCYVNFGNGFQTRSQKASDQIVIYSFVNSLTELPNVNRVQFMIDSETDMIFGDNVSLSEPFERNLDITGMEQ